MARHTANLIPVPKRETVVSLDVHNHAALSQVMHNQDIAFSALSAEDSQDELANMAKEIVTTMQEQHINRLIFMVAMGILKLLVHRIMF